jgi:hypothetical protein
MLYGALLKLGSRGEASGRGQTKMLAAHCQHAKQRLYQHSTLSKSCSATHSQKIKKFLDSLPLFRLKLEIVKPLSLESVRLCFGDLVHEFVDMLCLH